MYIMRFTIIYFELNTIIIIIIIIIKPAIGRYYLVS